MSTPNHATPLVALSGVVLDLETTGLDARSARVVQIGAVRIANGRIAEGAKLDRVVNPGVPIPAAASAVHGITSGEVKEAPTFAELASEIEAFIGNAIIIGHAVAYDIEVLKHEYALANRPWRPVRSLCVRNLARLAAPTLADYSIDHLCQWLGVPMVGRHTALGDAETAARLFLALIPLLRERGIRTLAEAEAACRVIAENDTHARRGLVVPDEQRDLQPLKILGSFDSFPFCHRVREVMSAPPLFADGRTSVKEGIRLLLEKKVSSVYIRNDSGGIGIVTERDLLRAIDEYGEAAFATPLAAIMSQPLQSVQEDAFVYRAIGRMDRIGFRHLGVQDAHGNIVGALTTRNLLRHRATDAIVLGDEVAGATSLAELGAAWAKLPLVAGSLLAENVDPRTISAVISSEIRAITSRAAELAEAKLIAEGHGAAPCRYAVLVLGSAGRGESLLAADQDNAIVYLHGAEGGHEDRWFEALGREMCQILHEVGIPRCRGGVMAKNRAWRMSLSDWKATIDGWVLRQRPEDLLNVDIFFDCIAAHGDTSLGEELWSYAYTRGHESPDFLKLMTEVARQRSPAFTIFGNIRVNEKGRIDLKKAGLMPIFTSARVLSIRHDVRARSTPDRLKGVAARGVGSEQEIEEIIDAHRVILGTMLNQQLADAEAGTPLSSRVDPGRLTKVDKRKLADALCKVDAVIDLVSEGRF